MDYPKSVPNVGLVAGKFIDENTLTGAVGSLIPSAWGNSVTDEILAVIKAAGIEPAEAETDQLLKAIRGAALFQTAPKFSANKGVATTEFVQQALGSMAGYENYSASTVLKAADVGKYIYAASSNITLTLPDLASLPPGSRIYIQTGAGSNNVTVKSVNGNIGGPNAPVALSSNMVLSAGVATEFISSGPTWIAAGGSGLASLSGNGYQKLPSGMIIQWIFTTNLGSQGALSSWPIAFPNACLFAAVTCSNGAAPAYVSIGAKSATQVGAYSSSLPVGVGFIGIGY